MTTSILDPHALVHTTSLMNYGPSTFPQTIVAFDLAHSMDVQPTSKTIWTLKTCITPILTLTNILIQHYEQSNADSSKHVYLSKHISLSPPALSFNQDVDDVISLGSLEPEDNVLLTQYIDNFYFKDE